MSTPRTTGRRTTRVRCPLTTSKRRRAEAEKRVAAIEDGFPENLARPALRALAAGGFRRLEDLARVREQDVAGLHGMGPKALGLLRAALAGRGLSFRK